MSTPDPHDALIRKLETRQPLDAGDRAALSALPCVLRDVTANRYLTREGSQPSKCSLILSGFAMRHKTAANGNRQIVGLLLAGDWSDLQQIGLRHADHSVQAITALLTVEIDAAALRDLSLARPAIGLAIWTETLVEGSIARELALNNGRRDAFTRLAHLLCEFEARLGLPGASQGWELPLTQEQLGDATSLTSIHVNRTLKRLENERLISRKGRHYSIVDLAKLRDHGEFDPAYLHLDALRQLPAATANDPAADD